MFKLLDPFYLGCFGDGSGAFKKQTHPTKR